MKKFLNRNRITGILCLALGLAYLAGTAQIPASTMSGDPGPLVFPIIAGVLMVVSSIGVFFKKVPENEPAFLNNKQFGRLMLMLGVMVAYVLLMSWFGYLLPSLGMFFIMSTMMAEGKHVPVWQRVLYAVICTLIVYALFTKALGVALPRGTVFNIEIPY